MNSLGGHPAQEGDPSLLGRQRVVILNLRQGFRLEAICFLLLSWNFSSEYSRIQHLPSPLVQTVMSLSGPPKWSERLWSLPFETCLAVSTLMLIKSGYRPKSKVGECVVAPCSQGAEGGIVFVAYYMQFMSKPKARVSYCFRPSISGT